MKTQPIFNTGQCYEMYFTIFNSVIKFTVIESLHKGYKKAMICETGHIFKFNSVFLFNDEIESLKEEECPKTLQCEHHPMN